MITKVVSRCLGRHEQEKYGWEEWSDSDDCRAVEIELREVSNRLVDRERVDERLLRVDLSSEPSGRDDSTPPRTKDCEACQRRLLSPLAPAPGHHAERTVKA